MNQIQMKRFVMPKKLFLSTTLALSLSACADMQGLIQKLKPANGSQASNIEQGTADVSPTTQTAKPTQPQWLIGFTSNFMQVLTEAGTINTSALSSLEQTTECKSLVTEMQTSDSLGQLLGMATKLKIMNLVDGIGDSFKSGSTTAANKVTIEQREKAIIGLFARGLVWLPMQVEKIQGDSYQKENEPFVLARESKRGLQQYAKADAMMAKLTANLPPDLPYDFQKNLFILKTKGKNAKAVQGGYIYIDEDVLDKGFEDRAYFALSHEISHLLQRHETKHTQAMILDTVTTLASLPKTLATYGGLEKLNNILGTAFVMERVYAKHHSGQEIGGDSCAIKIMDTAGLPRKQIQSAVNQFISSQSRSQFSKPETLGSSFTTAVIGVRTPSETHPTSEERIANLRKQMLALK